MASALSIIPVGAEAWVISQYRQVSRRGVWRFPNDFSSAGSFPASLMARDPQAFKSVDWSASMCLIGTLGLVSDEAVFR